MDPIATDTLGYLGALLAALGLGGAALFQLMDLESPVRGAYRRYVALLSRDADFLRLPIRGEWLARLHLGALALVLVGAAAAGSFTPVLVFPALAAAPVALLRHGREKRVLALEEQVDTWMLGLANTLRATPALGEALSYSARLVGPPFSEELDLMLKEFELGAALDDSLRAMAERIGSRTIRSVLSTLVVARGTGGQLSEVLETSAAQLREMARLEGVIRTKTAEGKSQAWVLALMPFGLLGAIHAIDPTFFVPLTTSTVGFVLIGIAVALWATAIGAARKILDLDV